MTHPLYGPQVKIQRAGQKLVELEASCREFFNKNSPRLVVQPDPESGNKLVKVVLDEQPPVDISILTGEIIYHLRSSFDQIAVAFARMSTPRPSDRGIYFPTADGLKAFNIECADKLIGVDADLVDQIARLKPYDGGDDTFRAIFRMAKVDKHLELIPTGAAGQIRNISHFKIDKMAMGIVIAGPQSLKEGVLLTKLAPGGTITPNHPDAKLQISGEIVLGNVSIYNGRKLVGFLEALVASATEAYNKLVTFCHKTGRF
jgi:hypothetical protein